MLKRSFTARVSGVAEGRASLRVRYTHAVAGGLAEHLTSFGATFGTDTGQTKISEWIRAGFGASTGTITEPYAIWTKRCIVVAYLISSTFMSSVKVQY